MMLHAILCLAMTILLGAQAARAAGSCDWATPRHDTHLTARQPCPGMMREAPAVLTRTPIAPGSAAVTPFSSTPGGAVDRALALSNGILRCYALSGERLWESHPPGLNFEALSAVEDVDGDGRVEIAATAGRPTPPLGAALLLDAETGELRWRYDVEPMSYAWYYLRGNYLPEAVGKQLLVLMHGYPPDKRNGYIAMFEFPAPGAIPVQRWRYDFDQYTCFPTVLQSDVDGDGVKELCVETHSRMWVLDALTGGVRQFVQWDVSPANIRSYGLVEFIDLNGDGREDFLCIASFAQHHEVLLNEAGKLKLAWAHGWDNSVTTSKIATTWPRPPVADVDGDGRLEVVVSMFNSENDARWMIRVYDAVTGDLEVKVLDRIAVRTQDVDGDGRAEILAEVSRDATRANITAAELIGIVGGEVQHIWREDGVRAVESRPGVVIARGAEQYALAMEDGAVRLLPHSPPVEAGPDLSRISAPGGQMVPPPLVCDVDGDGKPEIIHTWQGKATVYRWDRAAGLEAIRAHPTSGDPVLADLDGDGTMELVVGESAPTHEPVIRALRADGSELWGSRLPPVDRQALPHGRALYMQVGRFTGKPTPDIYALAGTPLVRSVMLDGATGKLIWEKSEFPDIERYWGPTVNVASVYDVDGDGAEDLVFTNPDYYCVAAGKTGDLMVGPIIPQKIFDQPSQGLYTLPAILERGGSPLVVLCAGHYFLGAISLRAEPRWYSLPETGDARSGQEGFMRSADGRWLIGFGRQNGAFACLDAETGEVRWELPLEASAGDVVACDINGDGTEEFVFGDSHGWLWAVADDGADAKVVWKADLGAAVGSPVIADVDGDGAPEIVVPTGDGNLNVLGAAQPG
ncbi:MAG: VCBS repeat-containing protein [Armatimonadota bacterium]|nr:MAG: VCBS repeat-containing protein [Armatimonadota bacterium]